ncbi:MAG: formate dehydrogenase accessory sulfurtransferase FdhD [Candidatus Hydrogenedentota bacterium]
MTAVRDVRAVRSTPNGSEPVADALVVEAPLHIKVNGAAWTTTMRTPGADCELARGLLLTEGIVTDLDAGVEFHEVPDPETGLVACLETWIDESRVEKEVEGRRTLMSSSSCGVCGVREPQDLEVYGPPISMPESVTLNAVEISRMMASMRARQALFTATGGAHAAAVFDGRGEMMAIFEDIGRHNAVDKAIGALIFEGRLEEARYLMVSGRVSFEIVSKAYRAAIPTVCSVSAASSMAVDTAVRMGMTLAAFCRDAQATVYTGQERIMP